MQFTKLVSTTILAATLGLGSMAASAATVTLNYGGVKLTGNSTLHLKQKLLAQRGINANQLVLKKVVLVAKSQYGKGKAVLKVGNRYSNIKKVKGNPLHFIGNGKYKQIGFYNPKPNSQGVWQIKLKGKIKVKKVILVVQKKALQLHLPYYGKKFGTGFGKGTLKLKQKVQNHYPALNLNQYDLKKVVLVAKTKHGRGKAALKVGGAQTFPKVVGGAPRDFHNGGYFYKTGFLNPKSNSNGVWQMKLNGKFKVKKAVLVLIKKY